MTRLLRFALVGLAAFTVACGDDDGGGEDEPTTTGIPGPGQLEGCDVLEGFDEYVAGLEKTGADGYTFRLVAATPAPPQQGENTWVVEISGPDATPLAADASFSIVPWMPDHGHGTNIIAGVTPVNDAAGQFEITPVDLWMPGVWTVDVTIENEAGARVDSGQFAFCIEG